MKTAMKRPMIKQNGSRFGELVAERVAVAKELRAASTLAALKLTGEAFKKETLTIARSTPERVNALLAALEQPRSFATGEVKAALRRMVIACRSVNFPGPPRELLRLNFLLTAEALAELVALGSNSFELFAAAAQIAVAKHPEAFGQCTDTAAHEKRVLALTLKLDEIDKRIVTEFSVGDLLFAEPDGRATFKISGGEVPVFPKENAAERLCSWILQQET